jgi:hypothetical protein
MKGTASAAALPSCLSVLYCIIVIALHRIDDKIKDGSVIVTMHWYCAMAIFHPTIGILSSKLK